jgi:hypothetical protein
MAKHGRLTLKNAGYSMPADAAAYQSPPFYYRGNAVSDERARAVKSYVVRVHSLDECVIRAVAAIGSETSVYQSRQQRSIC